ncbi:MAG: hypothetical protein JNL18_19090 [Planctomycetaceae bacterium]|uniref:Uncharacterized protein n=1 Tax=Lacipirellula limnantheis TaxID=2528024 RepID=A0A517TSD7_9BACT|nr:hypothetical protein [Lacipirellula limnantheis]MBL9164842.1 hypothetical protein [Planctomycetaceae bacterium]QDT71284.1 hypothetical protein I41_04400 [Lacipirellula limnantheis]
MHSATLLAEAAELARQLQYTVREEYLDGAGGGHCYFGGRKWLLLDVTQSVDEQLSVITDALRTDDAVWRLPVSPQLAGILRVSHAA